MFKVTEKHIHLINVYSLHLLTEAVLLRLKFVDPMFHKDLRGQLIEFLSYHDPKKELPLEYFSSVNVYHCWIKGKYARTWTKIYASSDEQAKELFQSAVDESTTTLDISDIIEIEKISDADLDYDNFLERKSLVVETCLVPLNI